MQAEIWIWSNIGHTPLTNRQGSYCDVLAKMLINVESPADAEEKLQKLMQATPHAYNGAYRLPEWWNQNERIRYVLKK